MLTNLSRRAKLALLTATLMTASVSVLGAPAADADDSGTLTVVGTSDVFDSNLVQTVIKPGFEKAYPQYTLNYVSKGTGAAIAYAEAGTASALLVHAASLENQFVADGYSSEKYGRAIFWGDYVLLGPAADPANVLSDAPHDIATAFEKVAAAGAAGKANFVSRGGTPGTTVQEHAIWALTSGLTKCTVSSANGGGESPSTTGGACSDPISYPSWYHATGLTQGPNITNADACNYSTAPGACYVFTDRGTFNYLQSTKAVTNLKVVTRDNATTARGGVPLLVNSFHAYGLDPAKFSGNANVKINKTAADRFLSWITSPAAQTSIGNFLNSGGDAPFLPSAAPKVTTSALPTTLSGGPALALAGTVSNVVPGAPALSHVPVYLLAVPTSAPTRTPVRIAAVYTSATGAYRMRFAPLASQNYYISTPAITKVENSTLSPVFGDLLAASSRKFATTRITGVIKVATAKAAKKRSLRVTGTVGPRVTGTGGRVYLYAGHPRKALTFKGGQVIPAGRNAYDATFHLGKGKWKYVLRYVNTAAISPGTTAVRSVKIR